MTGRRPAEILRQLEPDATADRELLERFLRREESAFEALVRRHGPFVLSVCRRITNHQQDAEDSFQAVFLLLAKKAAAIRNPNLLGNWLYGVAVRVSQTARRSTVRRRAREVQVVDIPEPFVLPGEPAAELGPVLHEELAKLPMHYRDAIVMCDLRGLSRTEAALALGIPEGTLSSRLAGGRKRLAERLGNRGVVLAAAAVPLSLGERSVASVPDSLMAKTCGLVANWRAGAALPAAVLRLTREGFTMRKWMLLSAFGLVLTVAGAVIASQDREPPQPNDTPKPEPIVVAKEEPKPNPKPEEKAEGFTTKPRLKESTDLPIHGAHKLTWSPDGTRLAFAANQWLVIPGGGEPKRQRVVYIQEFAADKDPKLVRLPKNANFIGFTPDGKQIVTALREYDLVSGKHQMQFWEEAKEKKVVRQDASGRAYEPLMLARRVNLEIDPTYGYGFAADGKTFRTLYLEQDAGGVYGPIEVREISMGTGETSRTAVKIEGSYLAQVLSPNGQRLALVNDQGGIDVWNVDKAKKESSPREPRKAPKGAAPLGNRPGERPVMSFSADSRYLLVVDGGTAKVFDNETGKWMPKLEGNSRLGVQDTGLQHFSTNNELLALTGDEYTGGGPGVRFLKVWELKTGKLLKSWPQSPMTAWSPKGPILAVAEQHDSETRLGLWDFAAEMPEKK